jgi:hypothetical protein
LTWIKPVVARMRFIPVAGRLVCSGQL